MRLPIWISNRHIHLSQIDVEKLFGKGYQLTKLRDISQPGQFACNETVSISGPNGKIQNVRVVGPTRKESQWEILMWDNFTLWTKAPVKISGGDMKDAEGVTVVWPVGEVYVTHGLIVAQRHLHCTTKEATDMWLKNWDIIKIKIPGQRWLVFENVAVRARDDYALDFHIDIEEANAAWIVPWSRWEIVE